MKRRGFRLEPVLRMRQRVEREAKAEAAQAAEAAQERLRVAAERDRRAAAAVMTSSPTGAAFIAAMVSTRAAAADASAARALAELAVEHSDGRREQWSQAAQSVKAMERLKERHEAGVQAAADRAEMTLVDDLVSRQHAMIARRRGEQ